MLALHPPVQAPIVRAFDYRGSPFARGLHRGIDLGAVAGDPVRAPCAGTVVHAGATPAGPALTLRCGDKSVTLLPLARIAVRTGAAVGDGAPVGTVGRVADHRGLHLGVRRAGDPFGYVDPAPLLRARPGPAPLVPPAGPRPRAHRVAPPRPAPPAAVPRLATPSVAPTPSAPLAPWPVWLGAALVLAGAVGGGTRRWRRTARAARTASRSAGRHGEVPG